MLRTFSLLVIAVVCYAVPARSQVTSTNCSSYSPNDVSCTTTGSTPSSTNSTTNCSSYSSNNVSCTTTSTPAQPTLAESMANGARTGSELRGMVDRIHAKHRANVEKKIVQMEFRTRALISDDVYNDTLMMRAESKHDTTSYIRLGHDRIAMNRQVAAMFDSIDVMRRHAEVEGIPRELYHKLGERLEEDSTLAFRLDTMSIGKP
jgi:prophage DNA circulation protein